MVAARFMLDTNIASFIVKGPGAALQASLVAEPMAGLCVSAITEAELLFGLARGTPGTQAVPTTAQTPRARRASSPRAH